MKTKPIYSYNTRVGIKNGRKQKININAKGKQTKSIRGINVNEGIFLIGNGGFNNNITSLGVYNFKMNSAINPFLH